MLSPGNDARQRPLGRRGRAQYSARMELKPTASRFPVVVLIALFIVLMLRTAWTADDAFITYRTVENFVQGRGLVWNSGERVQAYTHPLWMLLLAAGRALTGEIELTGLMMSFVLSLTAVLLVALAVAARPALATFALLALVFSKAFVDYSTSGLENPLSHLLVALFAWRCLDEHAPRRPGTLALLTGLTMLNRMDLALLLTPALAETLWAERSWRTARRAAAAFLPLVAWEAFSLIYYGTFVPNTAYAKLNNGVAPASLLKNGLFYYVSTVNLDPVLILTLAAALLTPLIAREPRRLALMAGVTLYMLYVVWIGGDFMAGRMLTPCLLASVCVIASLGQIATREVVFGCATVVLAGLANPRAPVYSMDSYGYQLTLIDSRGIADERAFYYGGTGLLLRRPYQNRPTQSWVQQGLDVQRAGVKVVVKGNIGFFGFYAGPGVYVVDPFALADPLLARLPLDPADDWGIGHYRRTIPNGYLESLERGENVIEDPGVRQLYDDLRLITRGDLFSQRRWAAIVHGLLGRHAEPIKGYLARGLWRRSKPMEYGPWKPSGD